MKATALVIALAIIIIIGGCTGPVVRSQCPAEDIHVLTTGGVLSFEAGELDTPHDYIINQRQMDELMNQYGLRPPKEKGESL